MVIVLPLGHTVQAYLRRYGQEPPRLVLQCRECRPQRLHHHGFYPRAAVGRRRIWQIRVYRWLCPACGHTVALLPDFLRPYARFVSFLREKAVWRRRQGESLGAVCRAVSSPAVSIVSERTVTRWVRRARDWVRQRGSEPVGWLLRRDPALALRELETTGADGLAFLWAVGQRLYRQVGALGNAAGRPHPGLFAFLNSLLGGGQYL